VFVVFLLLLLLTFVKDKEGADQQLMLAKKRLARLQKERRFVSAFCVYFLPLTLVHSFLLDRLLQYEQVSSDSESARSSPESNDEKDDLRPAKKIKREEPPGT
jgi:hypothetical protein